MTHLWVRAEQRANENRVGLTPKGAKTLINAGVQVTVEESATRVIGIDSYRQASCEIAPENSWPHAPLNAIIFGLKELPNDGTPLPHRHIMFGHAFKGQHSGQALLKRFIARGGMLYDLEYLVNETGRRVAAFGYWAGFAGAAVTLKTWAAQQRGAICPPIGAYPNKDALLGELSDELDAIGPNRPNAIVIGALGRVGTGAGNLLQDMGVKVTNWDMADTASGGPFPEILNNDLFINCILAGPETPVFVPRSATDVDRRLTVIGDVACDPDSDYNPVPVYDKATSWAAPALRVAKNPLLDVVAIDNLPSLLSLTDPSAGVWSRAEEVFREHVSAV